MQLLLLIAFLVVTAIIVSLVVGGAKAPQKNTKKLEKKRTNVVATPALESRPNRYRNGKYKGMHYTTYVDQIKGLKRSGKLKEAEELLISLLDAVEGEAKATGHGVAPWYYEQVAIIRRKQKRYTEEVEILERYDSQKKAPGAMPDKLAERLDKARILASK